MLMLLFVSIVNFFFFNYSGLLSLLLKKHSNYKDQAKLVLHSIVKRIFSNDCQK